MGIPSTPAGDHYVTITYSIPSTLTNAQRELWEQFSKHEASPAP